MPRHRHLVYAILLADQVRNEPRFSKVNLAPELTKACVYVGMTGLDPDLRFDRHKTGIKANCFVQQYCERIVPELQDVYHPMPYEAAREISLLHSFPLMCHPPSPDGTL